MDEELHGLKEQYISEIPTSFTKQNKQAVLTKIKQAKQKNDRNLKNFFPMTLTAVVVATFIFIGAIMANDFFENSGPSAVQPDEPDISGYVMHQYGESILVVSKDAQDFSGNGGRSEFYDAISLSKVTEDVQVGMQVDVWIDGPVAESYPMQGKIKKLEIVPGVKHEGANLTEAEALRKAIEINDIGNAAVRTIQYDNQLSVWKIDFIDLSDDHTFLIEVDDTHDLPTDDEKYRTYIDESIEHRFDPEAVQVGQRFGDFEVESVEKSGDQVNITFKGISHITGEIINQESLIFVPDRQIYVSQIPVANADIGKNVLFTFLDDRLVRTEYRLPKDGEESLLERGIEIVEISYVYSAEGSTISFGTKGLLSYGEEGSQIYETTIEPSVELIELYTEYTTTYDDALLKGLTPFDIFKLYFYAEHLGDKTGMYHLYIQGDYETPSIEDYFNDPFYDTTNEITVENSRKFYQELKKVESFKEIYTSDEEAVITFGLPGKEMFDFFLLIKDVELDVWKVSWMPRQ